MDSSLWSKRATSVAELSEGLPDGFEGFLMQIRALAHDEPPDYTRLREVVARWR